MTFEQLKIFLDLAETHSMTITCNNLNMSKNNVSKSISNLEKELSVDLFIRTRKGSYLTPIGEKIIQNAKNIFFEENIIKDTCKGFLDASKLTILFTEAYSFLMKDFAEIIRGFSTTTICNLLSMESAYLNRNISFIKPDICFTSILGDDMNSLSDFSKNYYIYLLKREAMGIFTSHQNVKEKDEYCTVKQLKQYNLIALTSPALFQDMNEFASEVELFLKKYNLERDLNLLRSNSFVVLNKYLQEKNYALLCDLFSTKNIPIDESENYCFLTIKPETYVERILLVRKDSPSLAFINDALVAIINKYAADFPEISKLDWMVE